MLTFVPRVNLVNTFSSGAHIYMRWFVWIRGKKKKKKMATRTDAIALSRSHPGPASGMKRRSTCAAVPHVTAPAPAVPVQK